MKKKQRMFPLKVSSSSENTIQFLPKGHQDKSWLLACPSLRVAPSYEGYQWHKPYHMSYIKHQQLRNKLSSQKVTPVQLSHTYNCAMAAQLPYLDNQSMAKLSLGHKCHGEGTVLPILYPEYRARTSPVDLVQTEQFEAPPFSDSNLYEAPLDSTQQVEAPSGPEHLPKIQNEESIHFNQQTMLLDPRGEVLPCSHSQTNTRVSPLACPSYQTKALTNSKHWARTITAGSENLNHPLKANLTPLPCLDQCSKATSLSASNLNPWNKTSAPKSSDAPKLTASFRGPEHSSRPRAMSSLQCSLCSKVISSDVPGSKSSVVPTPPLVLLGKAITIWSPDTKSKHKPKSSTSESLYKWHGTTPMCISCPDHQARASPVLDYKSKESSVSSPHSNLHTMSPLFSKHCAEVSSSLKNQVMNSSGISHWVEAPPQSNCWTIPQPVSNKQCEAPSGPREDGETTQDYIFQATSIKDSDKVSTIPSNLHPYAEISVHLTQKNTPVLSLHNYKNASRGFTPQSRIQLTSDVWDSHLQGPVQKARVVPDRNTKGIPPMCVNQLTIHPIGLTRQRKQPAISYQTPNSSVPSHKVSLPPSLSHSVITPSDSAYHAKYTQDAKVQCSSTTFLDHWEKMFPGLKKGVISPANQHKRSMAWSSTAHPRLSHHSSSSQSFDQQAKTTKVPPNTQGMCITAQKYQSTSMQHTKKWIISLPDPVLQPRIPTTQQGQASLTSDHHGEVQSGLQYQMPNMQNSRDTWSLKYIKPYTIEGGPVPSNTINDIISSIPQEKIKNDIHKQILLRRMRGAMYRSQQLSCSYKVCLVCASWVPNGCFHAHGTKYTCQAQLLVTPMPVPGSTEEMGVKFVLQIPQSKACSTSDLGQSDSPSRPLPSPESIPPESLTFQEFPPSAPFNILSDTDHKEQERKSPRSSHVFRRQPDMKNHNTSEELGTHERNVKSLLERLQRRKN